MNQEQLLTSFFNRREEADPSAQMVLDEFIRVAERLPADAVAWDEIAGLDQSWRDTLSDSQVISLLRAIPRVRRPRKERRAN